MKALLEDLREELWLRKREQGILTYELPNGEEKPLKDFTYEELIDAILRYRDTQTQKLEEALEKHQNER